MLGFMGDLWKDYLTEDAMKTFREYGYYVMPLRLIDGTKLPKTKMIALNTQSCYTMNLLLWMNRDDPANELSWLEQELKAMEANGEHAIIYGHVPPGDDCMYNWAVRFKALMERYQHVVRFNVYGHVHNEMFGLERGFDTKEAFQSHFWTGSLTTFETNNPSFRVFEMDQELMVPVKILTYHLDIAGDHTWKYSHEFTDLYGINDLSPASMNALTTKFKSDEKLALTYLKTKYNGGNDPALHSCDQGCRD